MSDVKKTEEHPEEQLWKEMKHVHAGMLGIEGSHSHMQPMAQMPDRENAKLWFFTSKDSDLVREMGDGAPAHFCLIGKGQNYHACLMGHLHRNESRAKIEEYWNDMAAAWWSSKDDPNLQLLEFDLIDAAIWASTKNPIKFAWEIQTSKHSDKQPDLGARAHVEFGNGEAAREHSGKRI
jgi:general stress protein 26